MPYKFKCTIVTGDCEHQYSSYIDWHANLHLASGAPKNHMET